MANELSVILDTCVEEHKVLKCKQNDNRTLVATLLDKGSPFSFANYINIDIRVKKADSKVYIQTLNNSDEGILFAINNNILTVKLEQDITRVAGLTDIELAITYANSTKITTFTFALDVKSSTIIDGDVVSENTTNLLEKLENAQEQFQSLLGINRIAVVYINGMLSIMINNTIVQNITQESTLEGGAFVTVSFNSETGIYKVDSVTYFYDSNENVIPIIDEYNGAQTDQIVVLIFFNLLGSVADGGHYYSPVLLFYLEDLGGEFLSMKSTYSGDTYSLIGKRGLGKGGGFEGTFSELSNNYVEGGAIAANGFITKNGKFLKETFTPIEISKIVSSKNGYNFIKNGNFRNGFANWHTGTSYGYEIIVDGFNGKPCLRLTTIDYVRGALDNRNAGEYGTLSFWYKIELTNGTPTFFLSFTNGGENIILNDGTKIGTWVFYTKTFNSRTGFNQNDISFSKSNCNLYLAEISVSTEQNQHNINIVELQDLVDTKVDKVTGKSLVLDTEIARLGGMATGATKVASSSTNGNIKINDVETPVYVHPGTGTNPHGTTKADISLGNVPNVDTNSQTPTYTEDSTLETISSGEYLTIAFGKIKKAINSLISHITNVANPHGVTKAQVGLGSVDNTSDINKPISTAQQNALNLKAPLSNPSFNGGKIVLRVDSIEENITNGNSGLFLNYYGYMGGTTQFRDFTIYNGKGVSIAKFQGSNNCMGIGTDSPSEKVDVVGNIKASGNILSQGNPCYHAGNKPTKADVGLGGVDNTADNIKNVLSASKLTTLRTINGVPFDGSSNITVVDSTKATQSNIDASISAIQIGGRNLLLNSKNITVGGLSFADLSKKEYQNVSIGQTLMDVKAGEKVTISFDVQMAKGNSLTIYNGTVACKKTFSTTTIWGIGTTKTRLSVTVTIQDRPDAQVTQTNNYLEFYSLYDTSDWFLITNIKIERGTKNTDFTPAIEDMSMLITNGSVTTRPTTGLYIGQSHFDTTLNKPIWYNGTVWKDATGTTV